MSGPLDGLVVVDASWGGMPTALAGMILADYGATVIKVERPGGDGSTVNPNLRKILDRGKWSVELDVRTDEGRKSLLGLLQNADVFLESFGSGRARRWASATSRSVRRARTSSTPRSPATGTSGRWPTVPDTRRSSTRDSARPPSSAAIATAPIFLGHPTVSYGTAFLTVIGILSALRARHFTGAGQHVDTSLLDGMLTISSMSWWWNEKDISYLARSGKHAGFGNTRLITDPFECSDGEWIVPHTGGPGSYKKLMDLLGFGDVTPRDRRPGDVGSVERGRVRDRAGESPRRLRHPTPPGMARPAACQRHRRSAGSATGTDPAGRTGRTCRSRRGSRGRRARHHQGPRTGDPPGGDAAGEATTRTPPRR